MLYKDLHVMSVCDYVNKVVNRNRNELSKALIKLECMNEEQLECYSCYFVQHADDTDPSQLTKARSV